MDENEINDKRSIKEFSGVTFSKYKRGDVTKALINCINQGQLESALNWSAELVCCGAFKDLWEVFLLVLGKHIHLANPKLAIYLDKRFEAFKEIMENGYVGNELMLRNNPKIRTLFAEIVVVLAQSEKKPSFEKIAIKPAEYSLLTIASKFVAPNIEYAKLVFKETDPQSLYVPINELAYNLSKKNLLNCCYWSEWILNFELLNRKEKNPVLCERRGWAPVDDKSQFDVIWMVWELITAFATKNPPPPLRPLVSSALNALLSLFCLKYTFAIKKRRRYLLYFALELVTEVVNPAAKMIRDSAAVSRITTKINTIYKQVKKNEIAPDTDYLFDSLRKNEKSNLEKSLEKMEAMNKFNSGFIPRTAADDSD